MKFDLDQFRRFCGQLMIDSKEHGQRRLDEWLGTQEYFIQEMVSGLENGIHHFDVLKGRQQGISTIMLAFDLFYHYLHPGLQGTLATDSEENRDMFRSTLTMYHDGLPRTHRIPLVQNNRNFMSFKHRSRMMLQIAGGTKRKGGKGRGKGLTYLHGTEHASWEDEESLASILASLAQTNPQRLFVFEGTARGFNLRQEMWATAKRAITQKAIFVGWWRNQLYRIPQNQQAYRVYWDEKLTPYERDRVRVVKLKYDYDIDSEQIAWYRWMVAEVIHDENWMKQEHPWDEDEAFILSGSNFFAVQKIDENEKLVAQEEPPKYFRFSYGNDFTDMECEETIEQMADLKVWEEPDETGFYSIGADPAYGSSEWADRFSIQVHRCYADRFEQVAEFCTADLSTYKFAWVLCYLAGAYKHCMVNLELNGPGQAVQGEINNIRKKGASIPRGRARRFEDVFSHMAYYLYRDLKSPGGAHVIYGYRTNPDTKERMLNVMRDLYYRGTLIIHSLRLLGEMKIIVREQERNFLGASGRGKDDNVIATALSCIQYQEHIKHRMEASRQTWTQERVRRHKREQGEPVQTPQQAALSRNIRNFLTNKGVKVPEA